MKATATLKRTALFALAIIATTCLVSQAFNHVRLVPTTRRKLLKQQTLSMHMGHSHSHHTHDHDRNHDHGHDHDHHEDEFSFVSVARLDQPLPLSSWGRFLNPRQWFRHKREKLFLAALMVVIPAMMRRRFTKLDLGAFVGIAAVLSVFDTLKYATKKWISKVQLLQQSVVKHSTPLTRSYFFKNDNAADRITLLGVYINVFLSVTKFFGGIMFNSAVLVADAGHSLSDLFSDFITLWAVQIARLPPGISTSLYTFILSHTLDNSYYLFSFRINTDLICRSFYTTLSSNHFLLQMKTILMDMENLNQWDPFFSL